MSTLHLYLINGRKLSVTVRSAILALGLLVACRSSQPNQANAGEDFSLNIGQSPTFDGCASTGEIVNYRRTIITAPVAMAGDVDKAIREVDPNCSFTLGAAMGVDEEGEWVIEPEVRDAQGRTNTDTVRVEVVP